MSTTTSPRRPVGKGRVKAAAAQGGAFRLTVLAVHAAYERRLTSRRRVRAEARPARLEE